MGRFTFRLPDVGEGTAEAEIVAWHVAVGDAVEEDQPLVDVMTDKATVEITSPVAGRVLERRGEPGEMFAVGGPLVEFDTDATPSVPEPVVPNPSGQRNAEAREAPPTTPATERPAAPASAGGAGGFTFRLPDVGEGTAEAEIVAWHVKPGDTVEEDQPLVDVMTDKATVEITSPRAGRIASIHGEPGKMLPVGSPLAVFAAENASPSVIPDGGAGPALSSPAREAETIATSRSERLGPGSALRSGGDDGERKAPASPTAPAFFQSENPRVLTSPAIRRRAREAGVDLAAVKGSGPDGRITREDFDGHLARPAAAPAKAAPQPSHARDEITEVKVIGLRRKIAEKMSEAKRRIPHFAYMEECDVTELEDLRAHLNATKRADQPKLTLLPFMIKALCKALPRYPQINARFDDEAGIVRRYAAVHLGMATQTPNGLIVPVIRDAQAHDVWGLATEIGRLAKATREGKAVASELSGSTITLTSLGPLGGLVHTPVINHPEVAIVGPNKIIERPVVRHGQIAIRKMMNVSSSFDHRVVDGWDAAEFIQTIKGLLEHPATLFMP
jgi:2-oxoisovalerate dehydrogenase E2 component (dihydrolipoyl transacylase)